MRYGITLGLLVLAALGGGRLHARELPEFYRGARAMAMGGAFTAIADDVTAVFYNPAGLALNDQYSMQLIDPKLDISGDMVTPEMDLWGNSYGISSPLASTFRGFTTSDVGKLFGKHLYAGGSVFPALYFPNFALGYYYGGEAHLIARNTAYPIVDLRFVRDSGFVGGFSTEVKGFGRGQFLRLGLAAKWLTREGIEKVVPISELLEADRHYISRFSGGPATGWGITPGLQYELQLNQKSETVFGMAWQDMGDTTFGNSSTTSPPPSIRSNLSAGLAYIHHFGGSFRQPGTSSFKLSGEMRHLNETDIDPRLKMHLGSEFDLWKMLSLQLGVYQTSITGGFGLNFGFFKFEGLTYAVDQQALVGLDRERRYMFQMTFNLDLMGKTTRARDADRRKYPRAFR